MHDYTLLIQERDTKAYFCRVELKADTREQAIKQANDIMNRFLEYVGEIQEGRKTFSWFN